MKERSTHAVRTRVGTLFALALLAGGCQWQQPAPVPRRNVNTSNAVAIHMAPRELVKLVQQKLPQPPISIAVDDVKDGSIFTDWKEYEGALHIVRHWRERTRFQINVMPDFNEPLSASHVEVFEETEEKPSDMQPWYPNPELRRRERSEEVLKAIVEMAGKVGTK